MAHVAVSTTQQQVSGVPSKVRRPLWLVTFGRPLGTSSRLSIGVQASSVLHIKVADVQHHNGSENELLDGSHAHGSKSADQRSGHSRHGSDTCGVVSGSRVLTACGNQPCAGRSRRELTCARGISGSVAAPYQMSDIERSNRYEYLFAEARRGFGFLFTSFIRIPPAASRQPRQPPTGHGGLVAGTMSRQRSR